MGGSYLPENGLKMDSQLRLSIHFHRKAEGFIFGDPMSANFKKGRGLALW